MTLLTVPKATRWSIVDSNSHEALDVCPCCGLPFKDEKTARAVLAAIVDGKLSFNDGIAAQRMWKTP